MVLVWLLVLVILVFVPWLIIPLLLFLGIILLPLGYTLQGLAHLVQIPGQLWKIAVNPRLRRNHALEHATINVIEEKFGPQPLVGLAREDGYSLRGPVHPQVIREAALMGLRRLAQGERWLALHRRCGTSMAAANLLAALVFFLLLFMTGQMTLVNLVLAFLIATLAGPLVGDRLQQYLTTRVDVSGMSILEVQVRGRAGAIRWGGPGAESAEFFVRTAAGA